MDDHRRRGNYLVTPAIQMTAAASGSNGITVADDDDIDVGTGDFFLHWEGELPDWTPSALQRLFFKTDGVNGYSFNLLNSASSNYLSVSINGTPYSSNVTNTIADNSVAKVTAVVVRQTAATAGSVTFYINGVQNGAAATIPAGSLVTVTNALSLYASGTSTTRIASNTISCIVGNFAPTAAEVLDLCTNGIPESWKWGSQTALYTSDFSAGADGWSAGASNITVTGNQDGINGSNDWLAVQRTTSTGALTANRAVSSTQLRRNNYISIFNPVGSGYSYVRITATGAISSQSAGVIAVAEGTQVNAYLPLLYTATSALIIVLACDANGGAVNVPSGSIIYVKGVSIFGAGATMALLPNSIPTSGATAWDDSSGNTGGGTLPASGATKVTIRR